ncbi:MAG: CBS domain-containing protein [Nitrososphaerota archaeon]|nr:CBS domain-containing protein [Nitrososphaerales archaeon]MDW8044788.1 CBS domain-containing protein [Nitrososphaerota archaeon]
MIKVKDVMSKDLVTIEADKSVLDAARLMAKKGVGCLIIVSGGKAIGIITERDLVSRVLAEPFDPAKVLVSDVMSTPIFTISSDQTLNEAAEIMLKYKVRRLPVVDGGVLVGIVTATDLANALVNKTLDEGLILKAIARYSKAPEFGPYK